MLCMCMQLVKEKDLDLSTVKYFVVDECDKVLDKPGEAHGVIIWLSLAEAEP